MKMAIFENEKILFENTFKAVNLLYFNDALEISWFVSSQEIGDLTDLNNYDIILVDLDLSQKSQLDGYAIIKNALQLNIPPKKIILFTGSDRVKANLKEKGLPDLKIIAKTPVYTDIRDKINEAIGA